MQNAKHTYTKLSQEELADPFIAIHAFFDYSGIDSVKENMWEWLKTTVSGTYNTKMLDKHQRHNLVYLYEHLEKLIEAVHILYMQKKESSKPKAPKK